MNTALETGPAIVARNETESLLRFEHLSSSPHITG